MSNSLCSQNRGCSSQGLLYRYITICFLFHFYLFLLLTLHDIQVTFIVQIYYIITIWDTLGLYKIMTNAPFLTIGCVGLPILSKYITKVNCTLVSFRMCWLQYYSMLCNTLLRNTANCKSSKRDALLI